MELMRCAHLYMLRIGQLAALSFLPFSTLFAFWCEMHSYPAPPLTIPSRGDRFVLNKEEGARVYGIPASGVSKYPHLHPPCPPHFRKLKNHARVWAFFLGIKTAPGRKGSELGRAPGFPLQRRHSLWSSSNICLVPGPWPKLQGDLGGEVPSACRCLQVNSKI